MAKTTQEIKDDREAYLKSRSVEVDGKSYATGSGNVALEKALSSGGSVTSGTLPEEYSQTQQTQQEGSEPTQAELEAQRLSQLIDQQSGQMEEFTNLLGKASETYQQAFKNLEETLGEQSDLFKQQLMTVQKQTGMEVDVTDPGLHQAMKEATAIGQTDFTSVLEQYLKPETTQEQVRQLQVLGQQAVQAGYSPEQYEEAMAGLQSGNVRPETIRQLFQKQIDQSDTTGESKPKENPNAGYTNDIPQTADPTTQTDLALENISGMGSNSILAMLEASGYDLSQMTSSEMLQVMLTQQTIDYVNDPTTSDYLTKMFDLATSSYESAIGIYGEGGTAITEIDKAISGEDFIPTTYEGLTAKIYEQSKGLQMQSVQAEKEWLTAQYDNWYSQEANKRGRLEGYLKAKLYAVGAQDSTAGLSVMAMQTNAADLRIQLGQAEYRYGMSKLNIQSQEIMNNYTNGIVKLTMDTEAKKSEAMSTYQQEALRIEGLMIEDDREKKKLTLQALSDFNDNMYKMDQDKKAQAKWEFEQSYKKLRDTIDDSYKLSGLTGTVWTVDENGDLADTGIQTFDSMKWENSYMLDYAKYQRTLDNDLWDMGQDMLDKYGSSASPYVEQLLGLQEGSLNMMTLDEQKQYLSTYSSGMDVIGGYNGAISGLYADKSHGGQCGNFMHKFFDLGYSMGDTLGEKIQNLVNTPRGYIPKVGDMVITNEDAYAGHVAIINEITEDGKLVLTESNYYQNSLGKEKVSNYRELPIGSASIMGYHTGDLKPEIARYNENIIDVRASQYYDYAKENGIKAAKTKLNEEYGSGEDGKAIERKLNALLEEPMGVLGASSNIGASMGAGVEPSGTESLAQKQRDFDEAFEYIDKNYEITTSKIKEMANEVKAGKSVEDVVEEYYGDSEEDYDYFRKLFNFYL